MAMLVVMSLSLLILQQQQFAQAVTLNLSPVVIPTDGNIGICPVQEKRDEIIQNITAEVKNIIQENYTYSYISNCGEGLWYRVAYLNMSNSSQKCPSAWRENNTNGIRSCRRPTQTSSGSCSGTLYSTRRQYSKVCGRAIGYQIGSTDGFRHANSHTIDSFYVYGVSFTHGMPRNHIWTLAAGLTEGGYSSDPQWNCPCADPNNTRNAAVPSFIGDNYYCESGNPTSSFEAYRLYSSDPLWDGKQCEGECCSNGKSPPWFSVELPSPTTDDIEVRICIPQPSYDDVAIELLEIYIQ